jgi:hypothetical protein
MIWDRDSSVRVYVGESERAEHNGKQEYLNKKKFLDNNKKNFFFISVYCERSEELSTR